jgi:uncharacterized protein YdiU (UPF0061 family)
MNERHRPPAVRLREHVRRRARGPVRALAGRARVGAPAAVAQRGPRRRARVDPAALRTPEGVAALVGNAVPAGATPLAQAYSGHQFGGYSPRLGDGRALLLGEVLDGDGRRRDVHLKGSGRTPFARGGDGKAAVGPMLREHVVGEAMHALGIPTTRALAVVATGDPVARETLLPGAVLARVAASHLRVGTFQYAAATGDLDLLRRLADYAIARHHPAAAGAQNPYLALFASVLDAQAALVAQWMLVGFVHGVMNTDNMTISGETIDYGPCAFMEAYDPATVFSSIDHGGRYAYGNQPQAAQWNLARLAEALLPVIDADVEAALEPVTEVLRTFPERFHATWAAGMRAKLGLGRRATPTRTARSWPTCSRSCTRSASTSPRRSGRWRTPARGDASAARCSSSATSPRSTRGPAGWRARLERDGADRAGARRCDGPGQPAVHRPQPPRRGRAERRDRGRPRPFDRLLDVVRAPFDERPGLEAYEGPAPESFGAYRTFCGPELAADPAGDAVR